MQRLTASVFICVLAAIAVTASCAANPIDSGLNAVEAGLRGLEQEIAALRGKPLPGNGRERLESKASDLRQAYIVVVRSDPAAMTREQENRWSALRSSSIDALTDMANLLAQSTPN